MCVLLPRVCKPHESEDYVLNTSTFIPPRYQTCCCCLVTQSCPILCDPKYCSPQGSSVHGNSPGKSTGVGCHAPPGDLPNSGIEPRSPMSQVDSLPSDPPEKLMEFIVLHKRRCMYHTYSHVLYIYYITTYTMIYIYIYILSC